LPVPDTDFRAFLDDVARLLRYMTMNTDITAQVRQPLATDGLVGDLCPRKCRQSPLSRPEPRLNTEHRTLNTPIRNPFRMGSL
jgi:hypothetical protein